MFSKFPSNKSMYLCDFNTETDSPVKAACSAYKAIDYIFVTLISAGTHCPEVTLTTSPGTKSFAFMVCHLPSLRVRLSCAYISTSASRALSAFESCHIATMPLMTRINRITKGST